MSHVTLPEIEDDDRARRAVPILVWAQAVLGAQMTVHFILGGLAGILLAENKALATLPITMIVLGAAGGRTGGAGDDRAQLRDAADRLPDHRHLHGGA
jgi:hypothetical protein